MAPLDNAGNFDRQAVTSSIGTSDPETIDVTDASALPDPSTDQYNVVIWDAGSHARPDQDPSVEIARVTGRDTGANTITVDRGQEGTSNTTHPSSSELMSVFTAKVLADIESSLNELADFSASPTEVTADVNNSLTQTDDLDLKGGDASPRMDDAVVVPQLSDPIYAVANYSDVGAAFNQAESDLAGVGTIYLPPGYSYSTEMVVNSGGRISIEGMGPESAALTYTGSANGLRVDGYNHVYISKLHLKGNGNNATGANGIKWDHSNSNIARNYIDDLVIEDFDGSAVRTDGSNGAFVCGIDRLKLSDIYDSKAAIHHSGTGGFSDSYMRGINTAAGTISGDFINKTNPGKVWIENCAAEPNVSGDGYHLRNGKNCVLYANKAEGCGGDGFNFSANCRDYTVIGNESRDNSGRGFFIDDFNGIWLQGNFGTGNTGSGMEFGGSGNTTAYLGNNNISYSGLSNISDGFMLERGWFPNLKLDTNNPASTGYHLVANTPICYGNKELTTTSGSYTSVSSNVAGMLNPAPFIVNNIKYRLGCMGENSNGSKTYVRLSGRGTFDNGRTVDSLELTFSRNSNGNKRWETTNWINPGNISGTPIAIRDLEMKVDGGTGKIHSESVELQIAREV